MVRSAGLGSAFSATASDSPSQARRSRDKTPDLPCLPVKEGHGYAHERMVTKGKSKLTHCTNAHPLLSLLVRNSVATIGHR